MGTSKSFTTPGSGAWTSPKRQLTDHVTGKEPLDAPRFVRSALQALGGVGMKPRLGSGAGGRETRPAGGGGGTGGGKGGGGSSGGGALGGAVQSLGGFGARVASGGLDAALGSLGLQDLRGRPAAEVVARIAEHLSRGATGRQAEVLETALRDTIFDIAAIEGTGSYEDLDAALQSFMDRDGLEGFIEAFLSQYVFTAVWSYFESHANSKGDGTSDDALASAVESACHSLVFQELKGVRDSQQFGNVDWFGDAGQRFADRIVSQLQSSVSGLQ